MWCRLRREMLKSPNWRPLAELARAVDPDPWRNALRDQYDRPVSEALPTLQAKAADVESREKTARGEPLVARNDAKPSG